MRDRASQKAKAQFLDVLSDLKDEKALVDWCDARAEGGTAAWIDAVRAPLAKGCSKYAKAVASILSSPALAYHALRYRDAKALEASCGWAKEMGLVERASSPDAKAATLLWEYLDELTDEAFAAERQEKPSVPTPEQIADDIAQRKRGAEGREGKEKERGKPAVLGKGAYDLFCSLCKAKEVEPPPAPTFASGLASLEAAGVTSSNCRSRLPALEASLPWLFCGKGEGSFTDAEWEDVGHILALGTVEGAIPSDMMRGIESVANQLVADLNSGKASMDSFDVEAIGQRVLAGVSANEVEAFASNIDKILPALSSMAPK